MANKKTPTPEEIQRQLEKNESFNGKTGSFEKIVRYNKLYAMCGDFFIDNDNVERVKEDPPSPTSINAMMMLECRNILILEKPQIEKLVAMFDLCDFVLFNQRPDADGVQITLGIHNVWEE